MTIELEPTEPVEPTASAPAPRRRWAWTVGAVGAVLVLLGGAWSATPHLSSGPEPDRQGAPMCSASVASGPSAPYDYPYFCGTRAQVTNNGLFPVTLSGATPAVVTGPGVIRVRLLGADAVGSTAVDQITVGPGEEVELAVVLGLPGCGDASGSQALTALDGIELTAAIGPFNRRTVVPTWVTGQVTSEDGSDLALCSY